MTKTIKYNKHIVYHHCESKHFDEISFYYLLKVLFNNSRIYNFKSYKLHQQLRAFKYIPHTLTAKKVSDYTNYMIENKLAEIRDNHLHLSSLQSDSYYNSKITLPEITTYKAIRELITLELLKYQQYNQQKAITYREKIVTKTNKHKRLSENEESYIKSESYFSKNLITYRTIANNISISLKTAFILVQSLIEQKKVSFETITINTGIPVSCNFEYIRQSLKMYSYVSGGFLFQILGSSFKVI